MDYKDSEAPGYKYVDRESSRLHTTCSRNAEY